MASSSRSRSPSLAQKLGVALALAAGSLGVSSSAAAFPSFPGYIQDIYGLTCAPTCLLCHTTMEGGRDKIKGTEVTDFVGPNRGFGVFAQNLILHAPPMTISGEAAKAPTQEQLAAALQLLGTELCNKADDMTACDSDGDGQLDVAELQAGEDPDDGTAADPLCVGPTYGCGAHVAPAPVERRMADPAALLAALGVALVLFRRRRA